MEDARRIPGLKREIWRTRIGSISRSEPPADCDGHENTEYLRLDGDGLLLTDVGGGAAYAHLQRARVDFKFLGGVVPPCQRRGLERDGDGVRFAGLQGYTLESFQLLCGAA